MTQFQEPHIPQDKRCARVERVRIIPAVASLPPPWGNWILGAVWFQLRKNGRTGCGLEGQETSVDIQAVRLDLELLL